MATLLPVSPDDVAEAARALRHYLPVTPLQQSPALSEKAGCPVFLKVETTQPTRSFKVRGALNRVRRLRAEERGAGVISASAGNHGQGVAYAAREFGIPATVYAPVGANEGKVASMRRLGSRVVEYGRTFSEANEEAQREAAEAGAAFVHAYDDPDVVAGQGTVALELLEQLPQVDTVLCPVGGGGLISGLAVHLKARRPDVRIVGVEPSGAAAMYASHQAGHLVVLDRIDTMADGLAASAPSPLTFAIVEACVDELLLVEEDQMLRAIRVLLEWEHLLVEPAGAAATAALLYHYRPRPGERIAVLVTGANVADQVLLEALRTR